MTELAAARRIAAEAGAILRAGAGRGHASDHKRTNVDLVTEYDRRSEAHVVAALGRARGRGCRRVYLITESASDFFAEKFGFRAVQLSMVDAAVAESPVFRSATPNAVAMVLDLPIDEA